jgi:hypothetical protein
MTINHILRVYREHEIIPENGLSRDYLDRLSSVAVTDILPEDAKEPKEVRQCYAPIGDWGLIFYLKELEGDHQLRVCPVWPKGNAFTVRRM